MAEKKELSERDKRLKAALRDNLQRRKAASRKTTSDAKPPEKPS